jgi:hypothetical protein
MKKFIFTLLIAVLGALTGVFFAVGYTCPDIQVQIGFFLANLGVYY